MNPAVAEAVEGVPPLLGRNFQNLGLTVANPDKGQYAMLPYRLKGFHTGSKDMKYSRNDDADRINKLIPMALAVLASTKRNPQ